MGRLEVQGIVSSNKQLPFVQFRQLNDKGEELAKWQTTPIEARELAGTIIEASMNAVYDAALIAWAKEMWPNDEEIGPGLLIAIRTFRSDRWGLPDQPEDWRVGESDDDNGTPS